MRTITSRDSHSDKVVSSHGNIWEIRKQDVYKIVIVLRGLPCYDGERMNHTGGRAVNWLRNFMVGRYGVDQLSIGMFVLYLVVWLVERIFGIWWLAFVTGALILLILFRLLSRNVQARQKENEMFLRVWSPIVAWWHNRGIRTQGLEQKYSQHKERRAEAKAKAEENKKYRFFTCELCKQSLRVPRGKGKVKIRCPKCGNEFTGTT